MIYLNSRVKESKDLLVTVKPHTSVIPRKINHSKIFLFK